MSTDAPTTTAATASDEELPASRKGAPQSAPDSPTGSDGGQDDEFEEYKISPLDAANQRRNLGAVLTNDNNNNDDDDDVKDEDTVQENNNDESGNENDNQQSSLLHEDEYSQSLQQPHNPNNHESALDSIDPTKKKKKGIFGLSSPPFRSGGGDDDVANSNIMNSNIMNSSSSNYKANKPITRQRLSGAKQGHSHPRKSPYRSEVARLRHEQQQAYRKECNNSTFSSSEDDKGTSILSSTNRPPDSSDFWKQSSIFKHRMLTSVGDFLTSAFADDEETSASIFSNELMEQLSENDPTITGIWLQSKNLKDGDVKVLCDNLVRNRMVTEVWLPGNFITDEGAMSIAHMLKFNKSIKELFLGQNDIGPKGAAALAAALARGNTTLVALGLGDNHVGVEGAGAFAAALRHNNVLRTLDLKRNNIPKSSSVRALVSKMLEFNATDPGDESLVMGLQEELVSLIQNLPDDVANEVVEKAEDALKLAMVCRRRGDVAGAAEAEGLFIRICTTGETPIDPPEESGVGGGELSGKRSGETKKKKKKSSNRRSKPSEPDRLDEINQELSTLKFAEGSSTGDKVDGDSSHFDEDGKGDDEVVVAEEDGDKKGAADGDKIEVANDTVEDEAAEGGDGEEGIKTERETMEP